LDFVEQRECLTRDRIGLFVEMIMAQSAEERNQVLKKLQELQKSDFIEILKAMEGYKVTIRLLDPPLHEFLPNPEELKEKMNKENDNSEKTKRVLDRARELAEINPMMGHRGVRVQLHTQRYTKCKLLQCLKRQHNLQKLRLMQNHR